MLLSKDKIQNLPLITKNFLVTIMEEDKKQTPCLSSSLCTGRWLGCCVGGFVVVAFLNYLFIDFFKG